MDVTNGLRDYNGEEVESCPICGQPLWHVTRDGKHKFRIQCECERAFEEEKEKSERDIQKIQRIKNNKREAFQYKSREEYTFANSDNKYGAKQKNLCERYAKKFIKTGGKLENGLLLYGAVGGGKTYLSASIANALLDEGFKVVMRSMPTIMAEYRLGNNPDLLAQLERCDLLIIDDLGAERDTSYGQELVYTIIDARYSAKKPFIISTNLDIYEMNKTDNLMYKRIYDRILEQCFPIDCNTGRKRVEKHTYEDMKQKIF